MIHWLIQSWVIAPEKTSDRQIRFATIFQAFLCKHWTQIVNSISLYAKNQVVQENLEDTYLDPNNHGMLKPRGGSRCIQMETMEDRFAEQQV